MQKKKSAGTRKFNLAKLVSKLSRLGISKQDARDLILDLRAAVNKVPEQRAKGVVVRGAWMPDDAPELTEEYFERADVYRGDKLISSRAAAVRTSERSDQTADRS